MNAAQITALVASHALIAALGYVWGSSRSDAFWGKRVKDIQECYKYQVLRLVTNLNDTSEALKKAYSK